jgi:aromatic ring-opening dioxygenase catalytic subunit (LigB family)
MARVVGAFATSHILFNPDGVEERAQRVLDGMAEVGRRIRAVDPELLVIISGDHMFNINLAMQIPICVGVADTWIPFGDMGLDRKPFPGHRALAEHLVGTAARHEFDIAKAEELMPDHGITLPLMFCDPEKRLPVVPILININMLPWPEPARCYRLGRVIREAVDSFAGNQRVAVIGTGGLSHWLAVPRSGEVAVEFDRMCMREIAAGRAEALARISAAEVVDKSGNGGIELVCWLAAVATLPGKTGDEIYYEPMPEWLTGMAGIAMAS